FRSEPARGCADERVLDSGRCSPRVTDQNEHLSGESGRAYHGRGGSVYVDAGEREIPEHAGNAETFWRLCLHARVEPFRAAQFHPSARDGTCAGLRARPLWYALRTAQHVVVLRARVDELPESQPVSAATGTDRRGCLPAGG